MKVFKSKPKQTAFDGDFDEEEEDTEEIEEDGIEASNQQSTQQRKPKEDNQLSKEEVGDLIEGHFIRASQLFQIYRGMK